MSSIHESQESSNSEIADQLVLSFIGIVNTSSLHAITQNNNVFVENQKLFLEIIVDFLLNIKENSSLRDKYNYDDKICSLNFLGLFSKALKRTKLLDYLIVNISAFCFKLKISNYLTDFIKNCFTKLIKKPIYDSIDGFIYSTYINNLIKSTKDFDSVLNVEINNHLNNFYGLYLNVSKYDEMVSNNFLIGITQTLCCLYNEESAFYDEKDILKTVLRFLKNLNSITSDQLVCRVCLICLAFKSNIIDNYEVESVYENLQMVCIFFF